MDQSSGKIQQASEIKKLGLYLMGLIFVFLLGGFFALSPLYHQYQDLKISLSKKQEDLDNLRQFVSQIEALESNYSALGDKVNLMDKALPEFKGGEELLFQVEKISLESGVVLKSITIEEGQANKPIDSLGLGKEAGTAKAAESKQSGAEQDSFQNLPYKEILLNLEIEGSFDNFKNFLINSEKSLRIMDVISFSSGAGSKKGEGASTYSVKIKTYALPAKEVVPRPEAL